MTSYILCSTGAYFAAAAELFREYAVWLNIDLGFQHFEEELLQLQDMYGPPSGGIILCKAGGNFAGCVAVRKLGPGIAELKRMYVKPAFQHQGIGTALLNEVLALAAQYGYKKVRLDTLANMIPAIDLYKKNGFYEISAYYHNPQSTAVYFEKIIRP